MTSRYLFPSHWLLTWFFYGFCTPSNNIMHIGDDGCPNWIYLTRTSFSKLGVCCFLQHMYLDTHVTHFVLVLLQLLLLKVLLNVSIRWQIQPLNWFEFVISVSFSSQLVLHIFSSCPHYFILVFPCSFNFRVLFSINKFMQDLRS